MQLKPLSAKTDSGKMLQLACLAVLGLIQAITMIYGDLVGEACAVFLVMIIHVAGALFLGVSIAHSQNRAAKKLLWMGLGFCLWIVFLQIGDFFQGMLLSDYVPRFQHHTFLCEYLVLLPAAALLDEKDGYAGLKVFGMCFLTGILGYMLLTAALMWGSVPQSLAGAMYWRGSRLSNAWHSNVLAGILLAGLGITLSFAFSFRRLYEKILWGIFSAAEFYMIILTNARAVTIMTSCILGGIVFCLIYRGTPRSLLLGLAAAVLTIGVVFGCTVAVYKIHTENFTVEMAAAEGSMVNGGQGSVLQDMKSFNNRDKIWGAVLHAVRDHRSVFLFGTANISELLSQYFYPLEHAHNSWLQILVGLGIVGFGFALYLTWLTMKNAFLLIFTKKASIAQKIVSLTAVALLGAEFFEVYIFYTAYPTNMIQAAFMLCAGYTIYWGMMLPNREKAQKAQEAAEVSAL